MFKTVFFCNFNSFLYFCTSNSLIFRSSDFLPMVRVIWKITVMSNLYIFNAFQAMFCYFGTTLVYQTTTVQCRVVYHITHEIFSKELKPLKDAISGDMASLNSHCIGTK